MPFPRNSRGVFRKTWKCCNPSDLIHVRGQIRAEICFIQGCTKNYENDAIRSFYFQQNFSRNCCNLQTRPKTDFLPSHTFIRSNQSYFGSRNSNGGQIAYATLGLKNMTLVFVDFCLFVPCFLACVQTLQSVRRSCLLLFAPPHLL